MGVTRKPHRKVKRDCGHLVGCLRGGRSFKYFFRLALTLASASESLLLTSDWWLASCTIAVNLLPISFLDCDELEIDSILLLLSALPPTMLQSIVTGF